MGYAVRKDQLGFRAVSSQADVDPATETYSNTVPAPSSAQQWAVYQSQARAALSETDIAMHRIAEGVSLGTTAWTAADVVSFVQYRQSLRAILSQVQPATIPAVLPVKPAYPAGT